VLASARDFLRAGRRQEHVWDAGAAGSISMMYCQLLPLCRPASSGTRPPRARDLTVESGLGCAAGGGHDQGDSFDRDHRREAASLASFGAKILALPADLLVQTGNTLLRQMPALDPRFLRANACCSTASRSSCFRSGGIGDLLGGAIAIGERSEGFDTPVQSRESFLQCAHAPQRLQHEGDDMYHLPER